MYFTDKVLFNIRVEINPVLETELVVPMFVSRSIFLININLRYHPWFRRTIKHLVVLTK